MRAHTHNDAGVCACRRRCVADNGLKHERCGVYVFNQKAAIVQARRAGTYFYGSVTHS